MRGGLRADGPPGGASRGVRGRRLPAARARGPDGQRARRGVGRGTGDPARRAPRAARPHPRPVRRGAAPARRPHRPGARARHVVRRGARAQLAAHAGADGGRPARARRDGARAAPRRRCSSAFFGEGSERGRASASRPAAKHFHQAYRHGLLEHSLTVAQAVSALSATFPGIDRDVAVTGRAAARHRQARGLRRRRRSRST